MKYQANPVIVDAYEITEVSEPNNKGSRLLRCQDYDIFEATAEMMSRMTPVVGDFWVVQSDGYVYLNPRDVFLRKYAPLNEDSHLDSSGTAKQERPSSIDQPNRMPVWLRTSVDVEFWRAPASDPIGTGTAKQDRPEWKGMPEDFPKREECPITKDKDGSTCATGKHHFEKANCNTGNTVDGIPQYFSAIFCQRCGEVREIKQTMTDVERELEIERLKMLKRS
jgi:hypothetical protein